MAGESPGRAEQRRSSGETTEHSGTKEGKADPRLAVRQTSATDAASADGKERDGAPEPTMTMRLRVPAGDGAARSATAVTERAEREQPADRRTESTTDDVAEPDAEQRSGTSDGGRVPTPAGPEAKSRAADDSSGEPVAESLAEPEAEADADQEKRSGGGADAEAATAASGTDTAAESGASGDGKEKSGQPKDNAAKASAPAAPEAAPDKAVDGGSAPEKTPAKPSSADAPQRPSKPGKPAEADDAKSEPESGATARQQPEQESATPKSGGASATTPPVKPSSAGSTGSSAEPEKATPAAEEAGPAPAKAAPADPKPVPADTKPTPESSTPAAEKTAPAPEKPKAEPEKPTPAPAKPGQPSAKAAQASAAPAPAKPAEPPAKPAQTRADAEPEPVERTKQQPLPPVPGEPLKLLAELTNTPPPAPTLLRSAMRRVKIWTPLVALLVIIFCVVQAVRPLPSAKLTLTSPASYTFGGAAPSMPWPTEGQAAVEVEGLGGMGAFGPQKPVPTASVAKVMTAYVILRDHPLRHGDSGPLIKIDPQAAADVSRENESVVKVTAGQQISEYEALEAIMLPSANNIARLLARWDAGSEADFAKKMNAAAKDLGMSNTTYTDPSGLDATTVSTAVDQIKLARQAMTNDVFREIVAKPSYKAATGDTYRNYNGLVPLNNTVGIKTGTSTRAGGNLVFAAVKQVGGTTQLIIGAVMGQYKPAIIDTVLAAGRQLIMAAQQSLTSEQVIKKGDVVGYVDDGLGGRTPVVATQDVQAVGWAGLKVNVALNAGASGVPHSAKAGATVGTLTVGSGPGQVKVPVALQSDLNAPSFGSKLTRVG